MNKEEISVFSYGKINLFLNIVSKRQDGYHTLDTILQSIDLKDEITIKKAAKGINITCDDPKVPTDEHNTVYQGACLLREAYDLKIGFDIHLRKQIPYGAGLAGGSGNGAAVLLGIKALCQLAIPEVKMLEMARTIGADVPFCLYGGTMRGEGIGDLLTPLDSFQWDNILVVQPEFGMSTVEMYRRVTPEHYNQYDSHDMLKELESKNYVQVAKYCRNGFEKIAATVFPEIIDIKNKMIEQGAVNALMTGSGSAVVGFFLDKKTLARSAEYFRNDYKKVYETKTTNKGVGYGKEIRHD